MRVLKKSTAAHVMVFMTDYNDHVTGKAGLTLTITQSKAGGAFGASGAAVTERGSGWYDLALVTGDTDTFGDLALHATGAGADPGDLVCLIVAYDPQAVANLGLTNLDAAVSTVAAAVWAVATRLLTAGTNIVLAKGVGVTGLNDIAASAIIDDAVPFHGASIALIKTKTDNLPTDPADASDLAALLATLQADTDNIQTRLPAALVGGRIDASVGAVANDAITAASIATDAIDADALAASAVDEILDDPVEGAVTVRQMLRGFAALLLAKASGGGTVTLAFRDIADTKNRVVMTVSTSTGDRSAVTLDLT